MARLDWKRGRFGADYETYEINSALSGYQSNFGDVIDYYRFIKSESRVNDIYDEGDLVGKVFADPIRLPVLHVIHQEGPNEDEDTGFYYNDDLNVTASFSQITRAGLTLADLETQRYLKDRMVYNGKPFRVTAINILGQIQQRDVIVGIEGTQLRGDELVNDLQFAQWSQP
jgi:hypothetical protein